MTVENRLLAVATTLGARSRSVDVPVIAETLGRELATRLRPLALTGVAYWSEPGTAVLAHVVARELDVALVPVVADEGRIYIGELAGAEARLAVVDEDWSHHPGIPVLVRALSGRGAEVPAVATALAPSVPPDLDVTVHILEATPTANSTR